MGPPFMSGEAGRLVLGVCAVSFLAGAVLMGLEMVGSRVLAPYFGSSVLVWGSLIGVVLAALSLGYYVGGYLADRHPRLSAASWPLGLAGIWIGLIPALARALLPPLASGNPGISGALWACASLFFTPSLLIATISPWCVRLSVDRLEKAGRTTGILYAVSNAGSIAGTFMTSFYLIPRIGVDAILKWMSALLLLLALLLTVLPKPRRTAPALLVVAALGASVLWGGGMRGPEEHGVIYEAQSLYHHIYVVDDGIRRLLRFDRSIQSGMYPGDPYKSVFPYTDYFHLAMTLKDDIKDVLMIGLGAGTAPKRFRRDYPGMRIECVELDPEVIRVARRYFAFPGDDRLKVHSQDGRVFLKNTSERYDLIVVDAYYADAIPFHLATVEFYEIVKSRLKPGGVLASNLIGSLEGPRSHLFRSMFATLSRVFPETYIFPVDYPTGSEGCARNIEVFAVAPGGGRSTKMSKDNIIDKARSLEGRAVTVGFYPDLAATLYDKSVSKDGVVVLTDDYAPVDSLLYLY